jgi:hypothetical protein
LVLLYSCKLYLCVFYCLQSHMKLFRGQSLSHLTACAASLTCLRPSDSVSTRLIFNLTSSDIGSHELELELIHVACHGYQGRAPRARHGMEVEPSSPRAPRHGLRSRSHVACHGCRAELPRTHRDMAAGAQLLRAPRHGHVLRS